MIKYLIFTFSILTLLFFSCRSNQKQIVKTIENTDIILLDSISAAKKILVDRVDGYFSSLTLADLSIQLRDANISNDRIKVLNRYRKLLQTEMSNFSEADSKFINSVFASAKEEIDFINPKLWPKNIDLYKTKTNYYGPSVYYTRENGIIIPENIFVEPSIEDQMPVMLHEIFHILSRYNDDFRNQMYALIGFYKFDEELILPPVIGNKKLSNPDGIRTDYAINLKNDKGEIQKALPLILSTKDRYTDAIPSFFSYLNFDLFPLINKGNNVVSIDVKNDGTSNLSLEHNADFFKQIKDNTQYIIHPDEIMADNFMMAIIAHKKGNYNGFSPEGKQLLIDVVKILKAFE